MLCIHNFSNMESLILYEWMLDYAFTSICKKWINFLSQRRNHAMKHFCCCDRQKIFDHFKKHLRHPKTGRSKRNDLFMPYCFSRQNNTCLHFFSFFVRMIERPIHLIKKTYFSNMGSVYIIVCVKYVISKISKFKEAHLDSAIMWGHGNNRGRCSVSLK